MECSPQSVVEDSETEPTVAESPCLLSNLPMLMKRPITPSFNEHAASVKSVSEFDFFSPVIPRLSIAEISRNKENTHTSDADTMSPASEVLCRLSALSATFPNDERQDSRLGELGRKDTSDEAAVKEISDSQTTVDVSDQAEQKGPRPSGAQLQAGKNSTNRGNKEDDMSTQFINDAQVRNSAEQSQSLLQQPAIDKTRVPRVRKRAGDVTGFPRPHERVPSDCASALEMSQVSQTSASQLMNANKLMQEIMQDHTAQMGLLNKAEKEINKARARSNTDRESIASSIKHMASLLGGLREKLTADRASLMTRLAESTRPGTTLSKTQKRGLKEETKLVQERHDKLCRAEYLYKSLSDSVSSLGNTPPARIRKTDQEPSEAKPQPDANIHDCSKDIETQEPHVKKSRFETLWSQVMNTSQAVISRSYSESAASQPVNANSRDDILKLLFYNTPTSKIAVHGSEIKIDKEPKTVDLSTEVTTLPTQDFKFASNNELRILGPFPMDAVSKETSTDNTKLVNNKHTTVNNVISILGPSAVRTQAITLRATHPEFRTPMTAVTSVLATVPRSISLLNTKVVGGIPVSPAVTTVEDGAVLPDGRRPLPSFMTSNQLFSPGSSVDVRPAFAPRKPAAKFQPITKQKQGPIKIEQKPATATVLTIPKTSADTKSDSLPSLRALLQHGVIAPGENVLTLQLQNRIAVASLTAEGLIRGAGGECFLSPMGWCNALQCPAGAGRPTNIKRNVAYQKVHYRGRPLSCFSLPSESKTMEGPSTAQLTDAKVDVSPMIPTNSNTQVSLKPNTVNELQHQPANVPATARPWRLSDFLHKCTLRIYADEEFVISTKYNCDYFESQEFLDSIDKW